MLQPFVASSAPMQGRPGSSNPLRAFDQQRSELNDQLTSLTVQRDLLNQQLRNADPAGQKVLQQQITLVGERTINVMKQLAAVDEAASKALAEAKPVLAQGGGQGGPAITINPPSSDGLNRNEAQVAIFGMVSVVVVLVAAMRWLRRPKSANALSAADVNRLERLQQSVDVIAIEMERVAESQRYVSKILGEGKALGAGAAEQIRVPAKERVKAP